MRLSAEPTDPGYCPLAGHPGVTVLFCGEPTAGTHRRAVITADEELGYIKYVVMVDDHSYRGVVSEGRFVEAEEWGPVSIYFLSR